MGDGWALSLEPAVRGSHSQMDLESPWATVKGWQIFLCTCICDIFWRKGNLDLVRLKWAPNPEGPRITALEGPRVPLTAVGPLLGVATGNRATFLSCVCGINDRINGDPRLTAQCCIWGKSPLGPSLSCLTDSPLSLACSGFSTSLGFIFLDQGSNCLSNHGAKLWS